MLEFRITIVIIKSMLFYGVICGVKKFVVKTYKVK